MGIVPSALAALLLLSGGLGIYAKHLRGEVAELEALVSSKDETIDTLKADVAERDQNITAMRESRDTANDRLRTLIAENNAAVDAEIERRQRAAAERDRAQEALRIALDTISTESTRDPTCAEWLAAPAPACAWDGLRAATQ